MTTTWTAPEVNREQEPYLGDERTMLEGWLDFHRQTLLLKCAGLTGEQLKTPSVEPSGLTLLGLVRHLAEVERWWFRRQFAGEEVGDLYCSEASPDGDLDDIADADPEIDFATYAREVELARETAAGHDLDETFVRRRRDGDQEMNLRWIYVHMIEEYARHNGHADLIRERIDGVTGD
ncbi:DinB family protein [Micromonospora sp. NPDC049559]|uniref:DinB family protein n=1 Tax=Micromonospora sp. NPDC049559 TaxID=3155923 RepID=UPI00341A0231